MLIRIREEYNEKGEEEGEGERERERERERASMPQNIVPKPPHGKQRRPMVEAIGSNC